MNLIGHQDKKLALIFWVLLISLISIDTVSAQVDLLPFCVTMVGQYHDDRIVGTATGFFYEGSDGDLFLVTNQHVLYVDPNKNGYTVPVDSLEFTVHRDRNDLSQIRRVSVALKGNNSTQDTLRFNRFSGVTD